MKKLIPLLLWLSLTACSTAKKDTVELDIPIATDQEGLETIVIMGTNDIHGNLAPETLKTREPDGTTPVEYSTGGMATLASYVRILRKEFGPHFLWLDGGDQFQGTIESNSEKGQGMVKFFNLASLGGSSIGNHEFDYGPEATEGPEASDPLGALKARMREAHYPYLAANILNRATGKLADFPNTYPSKIYTVGKLKVGVVGLSTLETPKKTRPTFVRGLEFSNLRDATLRESQSLREQGADIVVIAAHVGLYCNQGRSPTWHMIRKSSDPLGECGRNDEMVSLLRSLPGGTVDAVVSGHTHQVIHHWIAGIPVIQGGSLGRYFNLIYLTYDHRQKKIVTDRTRIEGPVPICSQVFQNQNDCNGERPAPKAGRGSLVQAHFHGKGIEPDPTVQEALRPTFERTAQLKHEIIGETATPLEPNRTRESALGNLVADSLREAAHADLGLTNAGAIRTPLEAGKITYGGLFRVLPFENGVVTLKVTGKELKRIIRIAESGSRGYTPVSGLKMRLIAPEYDAPADDLNGDGKVEAWEINRVLQLTLADGTPIHDEKYYTLATSDYLAVGGDDVGWAMQQIPAERQFHTDALMRDAAGRWIKKLNAQYGPLNSSSHPLMDAAHPRATFEKAPTKGGKSGKGGKKSRGKAKGSKRKRH